MSYSLIKFKDKEILYYDHRGLGNEGLINNMKKGDAIAFTYGDDELLGLVDFRDVFIDDKVWEYLKSGDGKRVTKKFRKLAVMGISGFKKIMLNTYNTITGNRTRAFDAEEEAKEWLVK